MSLSLAFFFSQNSFISLAGAGLEGLEGVIGGSGEGKGEYIWFCIEAEDMPIQYRTSPGVIREIFGSCPIPTHPNQAQGFNVGRYL